MSAFARSVDQAFCRLALKTSDRGRAERMGPGERLAAICQHGPRYAAAAAEPADSFFSHVPDLQPEVSAQRPQFSAQVEDWRWPSAYQPFNQEVAEPDRGPNDFAAARWFHRGADRPTLICLHGYLGGVHAFETRLWPIKRFLSAGYNVMLAVLPHHGVRKRAFTRPQFPDSDPRRTVEGFRQAMHDLRSLVRALRARGAPKVGAAGMSLGGYSCSLLSTLEPLDFVAPMIPLASIADFAKDRGKLVGTDEQKAEQHRGLSRIYSPICPLSRPCLVPPAHRVVIAAEHDHICPPAHAEKLAAHFEAPLVTFGGGHLMQFGRSRAFNAIVERLP